MNSLFVKRAIDVIASGAVLLVIWPILVAIAIWIRLSSRGPALFRQRRVGRKQESFEIYKFRTMAHRPDNAVDQIRQAVITEGADPRITRAGKVLRASSLDELPQLINILKGDMSLIGPRPIIPAQLAAVPVERYSRFDLRPGLTGLAQSRGRRGLDWLDQLAYDCEYVETRTLWLDIQIVLRTVVVVLKRSDIYGAAGSNWRAYVGGAGGDAAGGAGEQPWVI